MPKQFPWEEYKSQIYSLYITEDRSLNDVREIMKQEYNFNPAYVYTFWNTFTTPLFNFNIWLRIKTYRTKIREWNFPPKLLPLHENQLLVAKIKELWLLNFSSQSMLHALSRFGYFLTLKQLKDLRLHPTIRLLQQNSPFVSNEEISAVADIAISELLSSGQSLRWGAGAYTIASIRQSGILVSQ